MIFSFYSSSFACLEPKLDRLEGWSIFVGIWAICSVAQSKAANDVCDYFWLNLSQCYLWIFFPSSDKTFNDENWITTENYCQFYYKRGTSWTKTIHQLVNSFHLSVKKRHLHSMVKFLSTEITLTILKRYRVWSFIKLFFATK